MASAQPMTPLTRGQLRKPVRSSSPAAAKTSSTLRIVERGEPAPELPSAETLAAVAGSASAAFAVDKHDRIIYWNEGAEKLMGRRRDEVAGRACFEVLSGCDPFGNRYCGAHCPIASAALAGVETEPFLMEVKRGEDSRVKVRVKTVSLPEAGPRFSALVHLLEPGNDYEKLLSDLRAGARGEALAPEPEPEPNPLTTREREILVMLSNGYAALNIAARLNLSHATVRNHIQNILRKLEVHGQVEAIAMAFRKGWV